jgi:hypothetical protein
LANHRPLLPDSGSKELLRAYPNEMVPLEPRRAVRESARKNHENYPVAGPKGMGQNMAGKPNEAKGEKA